MDDSGEEDDGGCCPNTKDDDAKAACRATCNLKCKSESAEKKDSCVSLCYNQCIASFAIENEEHKRNGLKKSQTMHKLMGNQKMDESRVCSTQCVAGCGIQISSGLQSADEIVRCFENTCGCEDKSQIISDRN